MLLKNFKGSPLLLAVYRAGSWWAIAPIPTAFSTPDLLPTLKVHHQPGPPPQAPDLNFSSSVDIPTWILCRHPEILKGKSELSTPYSTCSSSHGSYCQGERPTPTASHWGATTPLSSFCISVSSHSFLRVPQTCPVSLPPEAIISLAGDVILGHAEHFHLFLSHLTSGRPATTQASKLPGNLLDLCCFSAGVTTTTGFLQHSPSDAVFCGIFTSGSSTRFKTP